MVRRVKSKYKKYLGSRTFGAGNTKNRRGKGCRGGKGYAGSHKHKWSWILKNDPDHFGKRGFVNKNPSPKLESINVREINDKATAGKLEKSGSMFVFNFPGKILGGGSISVPVHVKAVTATESAKRKIEAAGGKLEAKIIEKE
ncbi:MAG: uL15 family ribosomal protein [Candidatus Micrarchaeota archaeon]|nr:uL15 family ribosomal protein [Candidatus Micrarchaeota archaeon]